jgi:PAS domain S-box-containing protein
VGPTPSDDVGTPVEGQLSRRLFDNLFVFVGLLATDGTLLETNSAPLAIAGLDSSDVIGLKFWECYWWRYDPVVEQQVRDDVVSAAGGEVVRRDALVRIIDDGRMWIDFQLAPVRDDDGVVTHLMASGFEVGDRKATEAALAASEARLRTIFASVDEGFCLCEIITDDGVPVDYRFIEVNPLFEAMTGLTDPVGRTALELVPDLERHWIDTYGRVAFGDAPLRFQQGSDAMERWFDVFCVPVEPRGHFTLVFKDITAARAADASLQNAARRDRYRAELMDALRELVDPTEVQLAGSRLLARTLGASRVHYADVDPRQRVGLVLVGESGEDSPVLGTHRFEEHGPVLADAVRNGRVLVVDDVATDVRLADEHRAATVALGIASYVVVPVVAGGTTVGLLAVHHDAPRQWTRLEIELIEKTAERTHAALIFARAHVELRDSEQRFRSMSDGLPLPVWQVDPEARLQWANSAFYDHFGCTAVELAGDGWHALAHPDHVDFLTRFGSAVRERRDFHGEVLARHHSGTWRWLESWGRPHFGTDGRYLGHIGTNADITDRKATEEAARRTRQRADLLTAMITSLEADDTDTSRADRLLDVLVPAFADYATVEAPDLGDPVVALRHHDPALVDTLLELRAHHRLRPDDEQSISRAAGGRHQFLPTLTAATFDQYDLDSDGGRLLHRLGPRSHMAVPLDLGGNVRGALMVGISDPGRATYVDSDLDFLSELASHASVIIASAVLQEREHGISLRLQEALLPRDLASTDRLSIAARYVAASDVLEVGGDWFDSIALDDGRILLVVGDVVGHGLDAAAMMGRLRSGLAALSGQESDPGRLLEMLDHYARHTGDADYTTVCLAVIDPSTGALTHASAGHPPILVVDRDGSSRWLEDGRSMPLCVGAPTTRHSATTSLRDGALAVMYTDGLVERRGEHLDRGLERLRRVAVEASAETPSEVSRRLIAMAAESPTDDDTVVLCVRVGLAR